MITKNDIPIVITWKNVWICFGVFLCGFFKVKYTRVLTFENFFTHVDY